MRFLWLAVIGAGWLTAQPNIEELLRRAQDLMHGGQRSSMLQATQMLEGAAALCDQRPDAVCADVYDWLGMSLDQENPNDEQVLRDRIEPLYAKALARNG